jgi:pimeloyl-ACP methyl ester carboxylesterase
MHCDPWPLLAKVPSPVLILEGEESENRAFIDLAGVRDRLPAAVLNQVGGAGHLVPMERPRETTRRIGDFFRPLRRAK